MRGWKYDTRIKVRPLQRWSGGGGIVVQKWREGGESANTFYFTILFRNCCASALGSTCCGTVLKVFRKCDRPDIYGKDMVNILPRYPKYRSKISVRYEGSWGLIGTEGAKGI